MSIFDSISNYFKPSASGVRIRDVAREIPLTTFKVGKSIWEDISNTANTLFFEQSTAPQKYIQKITGLQSPAERVRTQIAESRATQLPTSRFDYLGLPKADISKPKIGNVFDILETAAQKEVDKYTLTESMNLAAGFAGGGFKKSIGEKIESIAKSKVSTEIFATLKTLIKGVDDRELKFLSEQLTPISNPTDVNKIINIATGKFKREIAPRTIDGKTYNNFEEFWVKYHENWRRTEAKFRPSVPGDPSYIKGLRTSEFANKPKYTKSQLKDRWNKAQGNIKERGFLTSLKEASGILPEVKQGISKLNPTYEVLPHSKIVSYAKDLVKESPEKAKNFVYEAVDVSPEQTATVIELMSYYQKRGEIEQVVNLADVMDNKLRQAGRATEAVKLLQNMSPEALIFKAKKIVNKLNKEGTIIHKDKTLDIETATQIGKAAEDMAKTKDPILKQNIADDLNAIFNGLRDSSLLEKVSSVQTMAQLLNAKTLGARNPLGNELLFRLERLNKYVATPIDWARSKLTGTNRQITFLTQGQKGFWEGFIRGAKAGWKGVSTESLTGQFDSYNPVFKNKWNPLTYLEKTMRASLQSFDFASFNRAKNQTIGELGWLRAKNEGFTSKELKQMAIKYAGEADENILKISRDYGKYVTFQDENLLSRGLGVIKRGLNKLTGSEKFGLGDFVVKYTKTTGAILMRTLDYSLIGFLRSAYLLGETLIKKETEVTAREVELAISRAITGTVGLTGMGYVLADLGIITGGTDQNTKISGLQKETGERNYQVNASALLRFVRSGFDTEKAKIKDDDLLISFDWAQPVATSIAIGANISESGKKQGLKLTKLGTYAGIPGVVESSITGGLETITEQPVVKGLQQLSSNVNYFGIPGAVKAVIEQSLSTFTPTILSQTRQFLNPQQKEVYDNTLIKRMINNAKNKIPFWADKLPNKYSVLGQPIKIDKSKSAIQRAFNVYLNPSFVARFKPSPEAKLALDIFNNTGETKVLPRVVPDELKIFGKEFNLTGKQKSELQKMIGEQTSLSLYILSQIPGFADLPESAPLVSSVMENIFKTNKLKVLTSEQLLSFGEGLTKDQQDSLMGLLKNTYFTY